MRFKSVLMLGLLISSSLAFAQSQQCDSPGSDLVVRSGQTCTLPKGTAVVVVTNLTLESGASLQVPSDVGSFQLVATNLILEPGASLGIPADVAQFKLVASRSTFGDNTRIFTRHVAAPEGTAGKDGVAMVFELGQTTANGLTISNPGGDGGKGVTGGQGRRGTDASCSAVLKGTNGAPGGAGGDGGNGGNGGPISVVWRPTTSIKFFIEAAGGKGGTPGEGGPGGKGGGNKDRCGVWPYFHLGGGNDGPKGPSGKAGVDGQSTPSSMRFIN